LLNNVINIIIFILYGREGRIQLQAENEFNRSCPKTTKVSGWSYDVFYVLQTSTSVELISYPATRHGGVWGEGEEV
jgi:hypothetical protein